MNYMYCRPHKAVATATGYSTHPAIFLYKYYQHIWRPHDGGGGLVVVPEVMCY